MCLLMVVDVRTGARTEKGLPKRRNTTCSGLRRFKDRRPP
ncbi:hypothetical protein B005_4055 [Nocardiopsis alba ATCC BAA-2165]|uniref:Uncharacterized protein n=1 Tax=Nocardiopsis alba (strain ATCC BAA-2165 / BE74) TaxID=1205910 RepID=J7L7Q2_NOCAA|nr:hypothetical protein B005_4055 [Nocardiopsis alba ATCC BAA-2165]